MDKRSTLKKVERLHNKGDIHQLFSSGNSFYIKPFKVFFNVSDEAAAAPVRVLVTVSKKNVRQASKRNLIKRRVKEAYRLNKFILHDVFQDRPKYLTIALIYTGNVVPETMEVRKKIIRVFQRLNSEITQ